MASSLIAPVTDPPSQTNSLEAAWQIGARLCRDALWAGDRCNWLGAAMEFTDKSWMVTERSFGPDLYSGTSGIALFLAQLHRLTGERLFRRTAEGALRQAWSRRESLSGSLRASFYSGWLGLAHARAALGELWGDEELSKTALRLIEELLRTDISPQMLDVVSGSAGAIPALLEFHRKYPRDFLLDLACRHADNLLKTARKDDNGWSWRTLDITTRDHLTGFSHGAAGIGWAFLELHRVTRKASYRTAAEQAFRYERRWFDSEQGNWADLRVFDQNVATQGGKPLCSLAWCHGAPGIALSRLRAYELLDEAVYRQEAETALRTTTRSLTQALYASFGNYSLCHGHCGNADALLYASVVLDASQRGLAQAIGERGIESYQKWDRPWPCGVPNGGETPGLMLGTAGIGYFYLRLHDSVSVPSVLLLLPSIAAKIKPIDSSRTSAKPTTKKEKASRRRKKN